MLRLLILFFTLNAILLPVAGYAKTSVPESMSPLFMDVSMVSEPRLSNDFQDNDPKLMPIHCLDCDMDNMTHCDTDYCHSCVGSHLAGLSYLIDTPIFPSHQDEIISRFKYFYSHSTAPKHRPPLA